MAAMSRRDSLNNKVLQSSATIQALHDSSPRMVPLEFQPECSKMHIAVQPKSLLQKAKGKMQEPKKSRKKAEPPNNTKLCKFRIVVILVFRMSFGISYFFWVSFSRAVGIHQVGESVVSREIPNETGSR